MVTLLLEYFFDFGVLDGCCGAYKTVAIGLLKGI